MNELHLGTKVEVVHRSVGTRVARAVLPDGRRVVLKMPSAELPTAHDAKALEHEFNMLRRVAGKGVAVALAFDRSGIQPVLVLEDVGCERLPSGPMPIDEVLRIALQVVEALDRVHELGVVHCDVNPSNLVQHSGGKVQLIDFGLATEPLEASAAAARGLMGTLEYIAPEQTGRMQRGIDRRADLYSLGVSLYELVSGQLPFEAEDLLGWVHAHLSATAPDLSTVSSAPRVIARIVEKLLQKDPEARYQSAAALRLDLLNCERQWSAKKAIEDFELGRLDEVTRLNWPRRPLERGPFLAAVADPNRRLLLVGGDAGMGKTALLRSARLDSAANTLVAVHRASAAQQTLPLHGCAQLLGDVADQLLIQTQKDLAAWREHLSAAVHPNGAVLISLQPRLEALFEPQPALAEVGSAEADVRRRNALRAFFDALAQRAQVLLLIDDAQWLDDRSLSLVGDLPSHTPASLRLVLTSETSCVGNVRSRLLTAQGADGNLRIDELTLPPLSLEGVTAMLEGAMTQPGEVTWLAKEVRERSSGNPLFVREVVERAHAERAVWFEVLAGRWRWDEARVSQLSVCSSALEMMVERLHGLSSAVRAVLDVASVAGYEFSIPVLRDALEDSEGLELAIAEARAQHLLLPVDTDCLAFGHKGIRDVLYAGIEEPQRAEYHMRFMRLLSERALRDPEGSALPGLVAHCRAARSLLTTDSARRQASTWEQEAGRKARAAAGYDIAADHLASAMSWLTKEEWAARPAERFALMLERAECVMLAGDVPQAKTLCQAVSQIAHGPAERADAHRLHATLLQDEGHLAEAIDSLLEGLSVLGVTLPTEPQGLSEAVERGVGRMQAHLAKRPLDELSEWPEMRDPLLRRAMELLCILIPPAHQMNPLLFVLVELVMFDLAAEHGFTPPSCKNLVDCGLIQIRSLGDYDMAFALLEAAYRLVERYAPTPHAGGVRFIDGAFLSHWRHPPSTVAKTLQAARREAFEFGDLSHASHSEIWHALLQRISGEPLTSCLEVCTQAIAFCRDAGTDLQRRHVEIESETIASLLGQVTKAERAVDRAASHVEFGNLVLWTFWRGEFLRAYLLGDRADARVAIEAISDLEDAAIGMCTQADYPLLVGLWYASAAEAPDDLEESPDLSRDLALTKVQEAEALARAWAERNPAFYGTTYRLLRAERRRLAGGLPLEVAALYNEVADDTSTNMVYVKAIACERHAYYWRSQGNPRFANGLLREAYALYDRWGARAKLAQLADTHPDLFGSKATDTCSWRQGADRSTRTRTVPDASLDMESVVKAVAAISSEVIPERLFAALMKTILENAGAQLGYLIRCDDAGLVVEARARQRQPVELLQAPVEQAWELPQEIVHYAVRTSSDVVLQDAQQDKRFSRNAQVVAQQVRSVLCLLIRHAGSIWGVLCVENRAVAGAFLPKHIQLLQIIAGQAAISLENARVYKNLEALVQQRTCELSATNQEMSTLLDNLPHGVFTIDPSLQIESRYSAQLPAMLGAETVAGRHFAGLLFRGSDLSAEQLATHNATLQCSFGVPAFVAEANWPHLVQSFRRTTATGEQHLEVDWDCIVDEEDNVSRILATVRDVTQLKALEEQLAQASQETALIGEVLTSGFDEFLAYCNDAKERAGAGIARLRNATTAGAALMDDVFRMLHTLKGNARVLGLVTLSRELHAIEEHCVAFRLRPSSRRDGQQVLVDSLQQLVATIELQEATARRMLSGTERAQESRAEDVLRQIKVDVEQAQQMRVEPAEALRRITAALRAANDSPVSAVVRKAARVFTALAYEVGKPPPALSLVGNDPLVESGLARDLHDALVHMFRNALDHGIEAPEVRQEAGKGAVGRVEVRVSAAGGDLSLTIRDDGKGLGLGRLRERFGSEVDDSALAEAIFGAGVSTAARETEISGRGVGMDAVRNFVARHGGHVNVAFTGPERGGYRPFELVLGVPLVAKAA